MCRRHRSANGSGSRATPVTWSSGWGTPVETRGAFARLMRDGSLTDSEPVGAMRLLNQFRPSWDEIQASSSSRRRGGLIGPARCSGARCRAFWRRHLSGAVNGRTAAVHLFGRATVEGGGRGWVHCTELQSNRLGDEPVAEIVPNTQTSSSLTIARSLDCCPSTARQVMLLPEYAIHPERAEIPTDTHRIPDQS